MTVMLPDVNGNGEGEGNGNGMDMTEASSHPLGSCLHGLRSKWRLLPITLAPPLQDIGDCKSFRTFNLTFFVYSFKKCVCVCVHACVCERVCVKGATESESEYVFVSVSVYPYPYLTTGICICICHCPH